MNPQDLQTFAEVSARLKQLQQFLKAEVLPLMPDQYGIARTLLDDCLERIAVHCDTAPARLIELGGGE